MTNSELRAKALGIFEQARAKFDEITSDTTEARASEITAEATRMLADADALEARAKTAESLETRAAAYEKADPRRPNGDREVGADTAEERSSKAFEAFLRGTASAEQRSLLREQRAQSVGTASEGGYLVAPTMAQTILTTLSAQGAMVDPSVVNELVTSTGARINFPSNDDTSNKGSLIGENTAASDSNVAFGNKELDAYKYTSGVVKVSNELLQDASFDVASYIAGLLGERLGRIANEHFTLGTGTNQPKGVVPAAGTAAVTSGTALKIDADDLVKLSHSVNRVYRAKGSFMMADSTFLALKLLKDANGNYVVQSPRDAGDSYTIWGHRIQINDEIAAIAANSIPVIFGDFKQYTVRRAKTFEVKRLDERYADSDQTGFLGFARMDGELMIDAAVKSLKVKAS